MDICFAFWTFGCDVNWNAWSAIGSLSAALAALGIAYHAHVTSQRARAITNKVVSRHMLHELVQIYYVSCWWYDLHKQISSGAIPRQFDPALKLAFYDLNNIATPIYDGYYSLIPTFKPSVSEFVLAAYAGVNRAKHRLSRFKEQNDFHPTQDNFNKLFKLSASLKNDLHVALLQLADEHGADPKKLLSAGPARYTDPAWWDEPT